MLVSTFILALYALSSSFATVSSTAPLLALVAQPPRETIPSSQPVEPAPPPLALTPPPSTSLTIITTALLLGPIQLAAIASWVQHANATQVLVFVDRPEPCQRSIDEAGLSQWVRVLPTPLPVSPASGKPKVSSLISHGQALARTAWVALFNSDILVSRRFALLTRLLPSTLAATGMRLDCVVRSQAELDELLADPEQVDECSSHGTAAFDFFLWPYGFWDRLLGNVSTIDMYIGEAKWDGLLMHLGRPNMTEVSAFHLLLHVSGLHNPAAKGWRPVSQHDMDTHRNATILPDNVHNAKTVCRLTFQDPNWGRCRMRSTAYEAGFMLCPSGRIIKIQHWQRKMYREAVSGLNAGFNKDLSRRTKLLRKRLRSEGPLESLLREFNASETALEAHMPLKLRLSNVLRGGEFAKRLGCQQQDLTFIV